MLRRSSKGFTLVELLVVIAIIGLLASVIVVSVSSARAKSRDGKRISEMRSIQTAIELYKDASSGDAPDADDYATLDDDLVPTYLGLMPADPGNNTYTYSNADDDDDYYVGFTTEQASSLGAAGDYCINSVSIEAEGAGCVER